MYNRTNIKHPESITEQFQTSCSNWCGSAKAVYSGCDGRWSSSGWMYTGEA